MTAQRLLELANARAGVRRTALPREAYERLLTCTGCGSVVACFEAATGARTDDEHRHIDPDKFTCAPCWDARPRRTA